MPITDRPPSWDQPVAETRAQVWLPSRVIGLTVHGPAVVHLDAVRAMVDCNFQDCTLMYHGERVDGFLDWVDRFEARRKESE
jgi:hypothetical protein